MPLMRVIDRDGVEHDVDGQPGLKIMQVLRELDYGVVAICGGNCACGTCHVYVDPEWLHKLPKAMELERELVSTLAHAKPQSRLSCQIEFTEELAGIKVTIAEDE
jgi:2Fe-2S ferredoxin